MFNPGVYTNPFGVTIRVNEVQGDSRHCTFLKHPLMYQCVFSDSWEDVETLRQYGYVEDMTYH